MNEEQNNIGVSLADLAVDADNDPLDRMGVNIEVLDGGCGREECGCDSHFSATVVNLTIQDAAIVVALVLNKLLDVIENGEDGEDGEDDYDDEEE